jgi:hypothetical protein
MELRSLDASAPARDATRARKAKPRDGMRAAAARIRACATILLLTTSLFGQARLDGVIDIHVHADPDSIPRSIDAISLAKLAKSRGMRGLVLKNHYEATASLAWLVRQEVPGIEIFGGIDLNLTVGGINPAAVERMTMMKGGYGRVVWMPTFDAENQVRYSKENRPFVSVSKDGRLLPAVEQVIGLCAKHDLTLETGHSSAAEGIAIVREGHRQGVKHMVVTHAMLAPVLMTVAQMREAAATGAYIEFVYNGLVGRTPSSKIDEYARAIREVGPQYCILASDLGQVGNPLHPDGLAAFIEQLSQHGFSKGELDAMTKTNPAKALGLE